MIQEQANILEGQTLKDSIFTVSQVINYLKGLLKADNFISNIGIVGEVTGLKRHNSGHIYFSLKDDDSLIKCAFFRGYQTHTYDFLTEGSQVIAFGRIDIYNKRGDLQFYVKSISDYGRGRLYAELERLKQEYAKKGYFDKDLKRPIPKFPERVGVVTASTGAAIRDILRVYSERGFDCQIFLAGSRVQGKGAEIEIASSIRLLDSMGLDVIIVARGGGSYEDLWCFNEPQVVEAIFRAKTPIVTGIGHEIDFTLADFTADYRAATPTQAAEIVFSSRIEYLKHVQGLRSRLLNSLYSNLVKYRNELKVNSIKRMYSNVTSNVEMEVQNLDNLNIRMFSAISNIINSDKKKINSFFKLIPKIQQSISNMSSRLSEYKPYRMIRGLNVGLVKKRDAINMYKRQLYYILTNTLEKRAIKLRHVYEKLELLSPDNILKRGYVIVKRDGKLVKRSNMLKDGDKIVLNFYDGKIKASIE